MGLAQTRGGNPDKRTALLQLRNRRCSGVEHGLSQTADQLVRDGGKIFPLMVEAIECLRSDTKYTAIVSKGRSHLVRLPLSAFEKRLDPGRFLKVNRACIVNLDFVVAMVPGENSQLEVQMKDGTRVTASREVSRQLRADSL